MDEYGFTRQCVAYRACEVPVLGLDEHPEAAYEALLSECRATLEQCDADSIVLGCAELQVPVIDGVVAAAALVEGLVRIGAHTSKRREFAEPGAKEVVGLLSSFTRR